MPFACCYVPIVSLGFLENEVLGPTTHLPFCGGPTAPAEDTRKTGRVLRVLNRPL